MSRWWPVEWEEQPYVARLWAAGMALGAGILVAKTASDTLLLSRTDLSALPRLYLMVAVVLFAGGWLYRLVADRWPKEEIAWRLPVAVAIVLVLSWITVWRRSTNYIAVYCLVELGNALSVISFWALLTEKLTSTQGKRLFPLIGSGITAGAIVGGLLVSGIAALHVADELLFAAAALFAAQGFIISKATWPVVRVIRPTPPQAARPASTRLLLADRQVRLLALLTFALLIGTTLTDYQWKRIVASAFHEADLAQFYGALYVPMNVLALSLQSVFASRVIMRMGSVPALGLLPAGLALGAAGILVSPSVAAAVILEASDKLINRTVHTSAMQLQFVPIEASRRGQVKALIDGQIRPAAKALGAVLLLGLSGWLSNDSLMATQRLSWLVLALMAGAGVGVWRLRSAYVATLWRAIDARVGDTALSDQDPLVRSALEHYFLHGTAEQVSSALELLERLPEDHRRSLLGLLLNRTEPEIIAPALTQWATVAKPEERRSVATWLDHPASTVRAAAVRVLAYAPMDEVSSVLLPYADDPAPEVRAAVAEWLLRSADEGYRHRAVTIVSALGGSEDENERKIAAAVIGTTGRQVFEAMLAALTEDRSVEVRVAAIRAVGTGHYELLRANLYRFLGDHAVYAATVRTLAGRGPEVCRDAVRYFSRFPEDRRICYALPAVLAQVDDQEAARALEAGLRIPDPTLRQQIGRAMMTRIRQGLPGRFPPATAEGVLDEFTGRARRLDAILNAFSRDDRLSDGRRILASERTFVEDATAVWLNVAYPDQPMMDLVTKVTHGDLFQQGNAGELLEQVAGLDRARAVLAVLAPERRGEGAASLSVAVRAALSDPSAWCQVVGAASAVELGLRQLVPVLESRAAANEYVQQIWSSAASQLRADAPDQKRREGSVDLMRSQVERVMALKAVSLFSGLDVEDIWHIAAIVEEAKAESGTPILLEGQPGHALSIIMNGEVAVHHGDKVITTLKHGDVFGEMSILDDAPVSASVTAITDVTLFRIASGPFYALLASNFEIARAIIRTLTRRLRQATVPK